MDEALIAKVSGLRWNERCLGSRQRPHRAKGDEPGDTATTTSTPGGTVGQPLAGGAFEFEPLDQVDDLAECPGCPPPILSRGTSACARGDAPARPRRPTDLRPGIDSR